MRWPVDISNRSRTVSRSRKQYQNIEIAPRSSALVPSHTRWDMMRLSSMWITRRYCPRGGTSRSSSVSTAPQNPVRGGVVGAHVEGQQLLLGAVRDVLEVVRVLHLPVRDLRRRRAGLEI